MRVLVEEARLEKEGAGQTQLRTDVVALVALGAAAAAAIFFLIVRSSGGSANPLEAVPADSFMVVSVDVVSLAQSPLGEAVLTQLKDQAGARAESMLGVDSVTATCGFDPLPHLRAIAVAVPEGPGGASGREGQTGEAERGDFGIAASGTFSKDALAGCARAILAKRGGTAATRQVGSFTVISDARTPGGAELAYRDGGPYLVGRGIWLTRMIDAADGRTASVASASGNSHAQLRAELATHDADAEAIRATALLPQALRERLQGEVAPAGVGNNGGERKGNAAMAGVLGVSAAAVGLHAGRPHEDARLVAELHCDTASACEAVSTLILHARLGWSGNLGYRLFGLGPLIDNLEVHAEGARTSLYIGTHASADDLATMVGRALHPPAAKKSPLADASAATSPTPPAPRARPDGGF